MGGSESRVVRYSIAHREWGAADDATLEPDGAGAGGSDKRLEAERFKTKLDADADADADADD